MIKMPYKPNQPFDDGFRFVIKAARKAIEEKNDDFLVIGVGFTGSGKSNQLLEGYEEFAGEEATVEQIALTRRDFATSLKRAKESKTARFVGYDEANVNKRDSLTKWNKKVLDLYWSIRGLRIFHWWCNPSLDFIDKPFIEERIKGVFFVFTKDVKRPRLYYYFRKKDILAVYEKAGDLKLKTLKKYGKKYAYYRGWFRPYKGRLLEDYLKKKEDRMEEKVEEFFDEYGGDIKNMTDTAKDMNLSLRTINRYAKYGVANGFTEGIVQKPGGRFCFKLPEAKSTLWTIGDIINKEGNAKRFSAKTKKSIKPESAPRNINTREGEGAT